MRGVPFLGSIVPILGMIVLFLGTIIPNSGTANAEPFARAVSPDEKTRIFLHNEPCKLDAIKNMPGRATWEENGTVIEGCFSPVTQIQELFQFYFEDKTVIIMPSRLFSRVTGA